LALTLRAHQFPEIEPTWPLMDNRKRISVLNWKSKERNEYIWLDLHEIFTTRSSLPASARMPKWISELNECGLVYSVDADGNLIRIWSTDNITELLTKYVPCKGEVTLHYHIAYWQDEMGQTAMKRAKQDIKRVAKRNYMMGHGHNLTTPNYVNFT
jgi:hypothetical protein